MISSLEKLQKIESELEEIIKSGNGNLAAFRRIRNKMYREKADAKEKRNAI